MVPDSVVISDMYKYYLSYHKQNNRILLLGEDILFEYHKDAHRIRPLNSVLWYNLNKKVFEEILDYMDNKIIEFEEENGISNDTLQFSLTEIELDIKQTKLTELAVSFDKLLIFLKYIYTTNNEILSCMVNYEKGFL